LIDNKTRKEIKILSNKGFSGSQIAIILHKRKTDILEIKRELENKEKKPDSIIYIPIKFRTTTQIKKIKNIMKKRLKAKKLKKLKKLKVKKQKLRKLKLKPKVKKPKHFNWLCTCKVSDRQFSHIFGVSNIVGLDNEYVIREHEKYYPDHELLDIERYDNKDTIKLNNELIKRKKIISEELGIVFYN